MHRIRTSSLAFTITAMVLLSSRAQAHDGPHGGELYINKSHSHHIELVLKAKEEKAVVYILDKKAKEAVWIPAKTIEFTVKGSDKPFVLEATNFKDGKASEFVLKNSRFGSKIKPSETGFKAVLEAGKDATDFKPEHDDD